MSEKPPILPPTLTPNISLQNPLLNSSKPFLILGLDLSLSCTGYCVLEYVDHKLNLVEIGHIITNQNQVIGERLFYIENSLLYVLNKYPKIQIVCKERGFSRFNNVTSLLNQVVGVSVLTIYKYELEIAGDYAPKTVKKTVSGSGNSSKLELQEAVFGFIEVPKGFEFANFDESDSVAVALTYLIKQKMIQTPI